MKLRTQLILAALAPLALAIIVGLAMLVTESARRTVQQQRETTTRLIRSVSDLSHLIGLYSLHHEARPRDQFFNEHKALSEALSVIQFRDPEQKRILNALRDNIAAMPDMFKRLLEMDQRLESAPFDTTLRQQEARLAGQLLVRSRQAVADGIRLESLVSNQTASRERKVNLLIIILMLAVTLPTTVILLLMMGRITSHLTLMRAGTRAVGAGDLAHRIGLSGRDELAGIAEAFDQMTANLQAVTVSKSDLEREVAERRKTEDALRQTLESIPGMVFTTRADGFCDYQSQQWVDYTGIPMSEHLGDGWNRLLHPEDRPRAYAAWRAAVEGRAPYDLEYRVRRHDGQYEWFKVIGRPIRDASGQIVRWFGVAANINALKGAEEALRQSEERLERLVAERTAKLQDLVGELEHFSYTIIHDMRAPLRAMKGFSEIVNFTCSDCERKEPKEFLARISTSADRMDALIRDALNYSFSVRQELPLSEVDTAALLRGILDSYPEFQPSRAHIRIEGTLPVVLGNEAGITQCFSNLLGNAVKFVRPAQLPEIRIWAQEREGWVRLWVEDKGIGIAPEMLPRVFDMFSRGSKNYEGTGIGLALVRKVTQRMGGRSGVESREGEGSRFWLELRLPGTVVAARQLSL